MVGEGDRHADLVVGIAEQERCKAGDDGSLAARGQSTGDADHVGFGDPHVEGSIGKRLGERFGSSRISDVPIDDDHVRKTFSECQQCLAERVAGRSAGRQAALVSNRHRRCSVR